VVLWRFWICKSAGGWAQTPGHHSTRRASLQLGIKFFIWQALTEQFSDCSIKKGIWKTLEVSSHPHFQLCALTGL
jgi:hypothetical protein